MSEFSTTDQQMLDSKTVQASGAPLFDDKGYTSFAWLQNMDMTPYDFPILTSCLFKDIGVGYNRAMVYPGLTKNILLFLIL